MAVIDGTFGLVGEPEGGEAGALEGILTYVPILERETYRSQIVCVADGAIGAGVERIRYSEPIPIPYLIDGLYIFGSSINTATHIRVAVTKGKPADISDVQSGLQLISQASNKNGTQLVAIPGFQNNMAFPTLRYLILESETRIVMHVNNQSASSVAAMIVTVIDPNIDRFLRK